MEPCVYRGIECPDVTRHFPHAVPMESTGLAPHVRLCDPDINDKCGYMTHDEAAILYNLALACPGNWIEIGSHTGWSTAHIAYAGCTVTGLDPEYKTPVYNKTKDPMYFEGRAWGNLERCGVEYDDVMLIGKKSQEFLRNYDGSKFDGACIDGEHEPPFPENDAMLVFPHLKETCAVFFHDTLGWPVQDGIRVFIDAGFHFRLYCTSQLAGVCWRGDVTPPDHMEDPNIDWPAVLRNIDFPEDLLELSE